MDKDRGARRHNQRRLRRLKAQFGGEVEVLSAHDPVEFERVAGRAAGLPATAGPETFRGVRPRSA